MSTDNSSGMLYRMRNFLNDAYERAFRYADWNIGIVMEPIQVFLKPETRPAIQWLPRPKAGTYLADPFAIVRDDTVYILCEEFEYRSRKGAIACIEFRERAPPTRPRTVMDLPFHMSYPYLFQYKGEIYCVPETAQAREIGLYRALEFPGRWEKVAILVSDIVALDNTLFYYGGRWWLTFFQRETQSPGLYVWHAPTPLDSWEPHAHNPVKTGFSSSRPAGTPFVVGDSLYRPAQDSSEAYGRRIVINEVIRLSPTEFEEEAVGMIEPDGSGPYPDGLHTVSAAENITLVDGQRLVFVGTAQKHSSRDPLLARLMGGVVKRLRPKTRFSPPP